VIKPDFFVLSGTQGLKKVYVRGAFRGDEVRVLTILYDQPSEKAVEPAVIAMSSAFNPFPAQIATAARRKTVEYGAGVVISADGGIVTSRELTDGCQTITVAGYGNTDRTAEDKPRGLALLRLYGARGLKPLKITGGAAKSAVELTGIADPQNQGGGSAASQVKSSTAPIGDGDLTLSPAPALGFSGSAVLDDTGTFAGIALLKPIVSAGPTDTTTASQATLVPADAVRAFLGANGVNADETFADAKASVVRVICIRK
jgi:hypothetical protein